MKCPICSDRSGIEIDMHADGYAKHVFECSRCGALWLHRAGEAELLIKNAA